MFPASGDVYAEEKEQPKKDEDDHRGDLDRETCNENIITVFDAFALVSRGAGGTAAGGLHGERNDVEQNEEV